MTTLLRYHIVPSGKSFLSISRGVYVFVKATIFPLSVTLRDRYIPSCALAVNTADIISIINNTLFIVPFF